MLLVGCALVATALCATACTATPPDAAASVAPAAAQPTPVPSASMPVGVSTGAGPYLVVAGGSPVRWADASTTLRPITKAPGLVVSPEAAYETIETEFQSVVEHQMLTAEPTAQLVSYSDSAIGFTTPLGVRAPEGGKTAAWVFRLPVTQRDYALVGSDAPPVQPLGGCEAYFVVTAVTSELLTQGQHCDAPGLAPDGPFAGAAAAAG
ncbi:hypothetical protein GCM10022256_27190 [Frondihabitans peucedani]|uniref:Uncharacterized protein n=2 Tax=Frondihabitans peucedani TaxID=598626 RepID=A0ABP8E4L5_9MICO